MRYRGLPVSYDLIPLAKFELFIPDDRLELVVKTIKENARTGEAYDGVIAISDLDNVMNITPTDK
jgi:nitrogen regulatory protein P-II 1